MGDWSIGVLSAALVALLVMSGYFSGSETAMMALNRYRLRSMSERGHVGARRASRLLARPDRLIGLILFGNNLVNILASQIAAIMTLRLWGEEGLLVSALVLTGVVLIFSEVVPKTYAALNPERIAFPSSVLLQILLFFLFPAIWVVNALSNTVLSLFRIDPERGGADPLDREELRTVVKEAGALIPRKHREMLSGILDLEYATVEDIMVPRGDIVGIDLEDDWVDVEEQLRAFRHTRIPCYRNTINEIVGILHMRNLARELQSNEEFNRQSLEALLREPYFVPATADLHTQLINFQRNRQRIALAVDEYGDIEGLVTLDDLLEEVVGEFTTDPTVHMRDVSPQNDGSFLVDASASIRELNRAYHWELPEDGPKTLNGLVLEELEDIPEPGTSVRVGLTTLEIVHSTRNLVRTVRVWPPAEPESVLATEEISNSDA